MSLHLLYKITSSGDKNSIEELITSLPKKGLTVNYSVSFLYIIDKKKDIRIQGTIRVQNLYRVNLKVITKHLELDYLSPYFDEFATKELLLFKIKEFILENKNLLEESSYRLSKNQSLIDTPKTDDEIDFNFNFEDFEGIDNSNNNNPFDEEKNEEFYLSRSYKKFDTDFKLLQSINENSTLEDITEGLNIINSFFEYFDNMIEPLESISIKAKSQLRNNYNKIYHPHLERLLILKEKKINKINNIID